MLHRNIARGAGRGGKAARARAGAGLRALRLAWLGGCLLASPAVAQAENSSDELRRWLSQLQAAGATVQAGAIESAADGAATARNVVIEAPLAPGQSVRLKFALGALKLSGADETGAVYRAKQAHIDRLRVTSGDAFLDVAAVDLKDVALARALPSQFDPQHPTASLVRLARALFSTHLGDITLTGLGWALSGAGPEASDTLASLAAEGGDAGTIASVRLRDYRARRKEPQSETRIAEVALRQVSLAAFLAMIDPEAYRNVRLERRWTPLLGALTLTAFDTRGAGSHTTLQQIELGPLEGRPFPFDPTPIIDLAAATPAKLAQQPALTAKFSDGLADSLNIAKFTARGFATDDGADPPMRRTQADSIDVVDLALRTAKSVSVRVLTILSGGGGVRIETLGASDVEIATGAVIKNGAPAPTIPKFATLSLERILLVRPGVDVTLGTVKVAAGDYIGAMPTHLDASIEGVAIPAGDLPDTSLKANLTALKIDSLKLNAAVIADWQEAGEELDLSSIRLDIADVGSLSATASLTNVPRSTFEHPETLSDSAARAEVKQARLDFKDDGLTGRVLASIASANKVSPEKVRSGLTENMPTVFGAIPDASTRSRLIFAAVNFLNNPKTLSVLTTLETPIPLAKVLDAARAAPQTVPGLLKLDAHANQQF